MSSPNTAPDAIIIAAMDDETAPFLARASTVGEPLAVGNSQQRRITLAGRSILLVRSGIGLVNAASATTSAILATEPANGPAPMVISAGTAGGIGESVRVGDVVVGNEYLNADADARAFGYVLGQVPRMPASYLADTGALDTLDASYVPRALPREVRDPLIQTGLIVSSYSFVTVERALRIRQDFVGALATDMETVAIAQTCHVFGRRFLSVRGISDLCGPVASEDFLTHVDDAADRSADLVVALLDGLVGP